MIFEVMESEPTAGQTDPAPDLRSRSAPIIERAPLPIVEVQGSAHLVSYVNSAFCTLVGKTREELVGKAFGEIVCGGENCVPILDQVYQTGEAATHAHEDDSDPNPAYWLYAMWPAVDANKRPVGVIIQLTRAAQFRQNATEITEALLIAGLRQHELTEAAEKLNDQLQREIAERKESEKRVRVSEMRFRRLFEAAQDGIIILDPVSRTITDANPFMTQLLGYSRKELLGKELWQIGLLKDEQASQAAFRELQAKEYIRYEDLPLQTKGGERREVEFVSNLYDEAGHEVIQCSIRDITERKRAEEALREAKDRLADRAGELERLVLERTASLRETVGELEAFSYAVVHDLRGPLRAMLGFGRILEQECHDKVGETGREYIRRIVDSADRMDLLIQDVLSLSQIARSELPLRSVDLDRLVRGIHESYPRLQAPQAEIEIQGALPAVLGNEAALTQCIASLLENAVKFVASNVKPHVRIWAEQDERWVRLFFRDNAIGIAPEHQEQIFSIFQRLSTKYEGTGIGLAIVKKAIERMGGKVSLVSEVGQGSTFRLDLQRAHVT